MQREEVTGCKLPYVQMYFEIHTGADRMNRFGCVLVRYGSARYALFESLREFVTEIITSQEPGWYRGYDSSLI